MHFSCSHVVNARVTYIEEFTNSQLQGWKNQLYSRPNTVIDQILTLRVLAYIGSILYACYICSIFVNQGCVQQITVPL